jgi:prophage DNA circulation protein
MIWRDKLLPASYRGVFFGVFNHDSSIGVWRVQVHRYPGRDWHLAEDLGLKPLEFSFEAFVLGDNYRQPRRSCGRHGHGGCSRPLAQSAG